MSKQIDIVLFGASGFTGAYCIESLHKLTTTSGPLKLSWGIAGRSEKRLKDTLQEYENKIGGDLSSVPIIIADIDDFESLKRMTAQARVIINCCGPYRSYEDAVIKACVETATHQVDIAVEVPYIEAIEYKYQKAAEEKHIYIVSACGFASIPADLGVLLLQKKFEGTVNSIEYYIEFHGGNKGFGANYGSYESHVYMVEDWKEVIRLRRRLHQHLPKFWPKLKSKPTIHKSNAINKWCLLFDGTDHSVIQRTQRHLFNKHRARPLQIYTYLGLESLFALLYMVVLVAVFSFLAKLKWGKSVLLKYPSYFTAGLITNEPPMKSTLDLTEFAITLRAKGWNEKSADGSHKFKTSPNKFMTARMSGNNPGYIITANAVTLAAMVILSEADKLPKSGGVYTPGIAFQRTSLMEMIQEHGLKFEIL